MRALVQRVSSASVDVGGERLATIGPGLLVLLGITHDDDAARADKLAAKHGLKLFKRRGGKLWVSRTTVASGHSARKSSTFFVDAPRKRWMAWSSSATAVTGPSGPAASRRSRRP